MKRLSTLLLPAALVCAFPCLVRADLLSQGKMYSRTVLMTDSADHITGKTGLTLTVTASKNGAAFAAIGGTVTEIGNGRYKIALTTTDTSTLGPLDLYVTAAGADPSDTHDQVVAFDPQDATLLGLTGVATVANQTSNATAVTAIKAQTDKLTFDGSNNIASQVKAYFTNLDPATLVLGATAVTYNTAGSIGQKINSAGAASDPLANPTSGYTTPGTIGKLLVDNINATIGSRQASGNVTVGGYATGQDPATLVLNATLYGGLTFKQMQAVNFALQLDASRTWNATTHTSVYTWYVRTGINTVDLTKPLVTKTSVYDSTNTQIVTQTTNIVAANLP